MRTVALQEAQQRQTRRDSSDFSLWQMEYVVYLHVKWYLQQGNYSDLLRAFKILVVCVCI